MPSSNSLRALFILLVWGTACLRAEEPVALETGGPRTIKRLNETLTRAGYPALSAEQLGADAHVAVVLSDAAAHQAATADDPIRSPLPPDAIADAAHVTAERVATARGITGEQAEELHEERAISYAELLTLPTAVLKQAVFEHEREAGDHPDEAMRWEESFKLDETGKVSPAAIERARQQALALPLNTLLLPADVPAAAKSGQAVTAQTVTPTSWTWKGPGNVGGRIRTMVIHPTQTNRMWIGSVSGGIWYSSNSGTSWSPVNDFMSNLAVSTLVLDPTNPNTMYAGTGEGFYNADGIRGAGIYKSSDGGVTWAQIASTANTNFLYVQSIAVSPDGTTLLAATSTDIFGTNYIYRSTDGGKTWTAALNSGSSRVCHVEFNPTDSTKVIASGYNHLTLYSTNAGASWTSAATGPTGGTGYSNGSTSNGGRVEVRYARSNPSIVYAAYDYGSASYLYKSTDGGVNYATVNTTGTWLTSQGWYANALWVSPVDPTLVVAGGLDIYRSTDGGVSFTKISNWQNAPTSAHADHHGIFSDPGYNASSDNVVYFTNDGGIYKAANVSTVTTTNGWTVLNNQLGITQFYGAGVNAATGTIVAGAQDNGTVRFTTSAGAQAWSTMFGGDGGFAAADQANSAYFYGEYVYLDIHRSTNSGASSSYIYTGISDANGSAAEFIAPFILDPNNQTTLLAGGTSLWRTTNARASTVSWASIKAADGTSHITTVAVAPGNSDIIWVGHLNGDVYMTTNGTAASPTWTKMDDNATALPARRVTRISIDPTNSSRVYVTFGGYTAGNVWQTTTAGASWFNSTGTLPAAPVYDLAISPSTPQTIYAGTDVGVFASDNGGTTWSTTNVGPTLASVQQLFVSGGNTLVTVTHGRGVFTSPLVVADTTPPALTITPTDSSPTNVSPVTFHLDWSEPVNGFVLGDVQVSGGTATALTGSNANYLLTVAPSGNVSTITVSVPASSVTDTAGNANTAAASATVGYNYQSPFLYGTAFDGTTAPTGWSSNGDWQWGVPTSGPNADHTSGSGSLYATILGANYNDNTSEYLTTPTFSLPSSGLPYRLRFWMWLNAESAYDGGNLEISSNGGAFTVVPSASLSVPYNSTTVASMPGGLGWTGSTYAAWTKVRLDLSGYAGGTVQFRYHFTSDPSVNYAGWYIDDFALEQDPVVTLAASDAVAVDGGNNAAFSLNLFPAAPGPLGIGYSVAGTAVNGTDYTVLGGIAPVAAGALTGTVSVVPINRNGARPRTQTVVLALANGTGYTVGSPNTATVYIAGEAGYDAWRAAHFTDAEFTNDKISGPSADPDGDGISNELEYALGLDPKTSDAKGLPTPQIVTVGGQNYLSMTVVKPHTNTDVTYGAEVSGDLVTWDGSSSAVQTDTQTNTPAGYDTITFRDLTPMAAAAPGNRRFLRLRITQN